MASISVIIIKQGGIFQSCEKEIECGKIRSLGVKEIEVPLPPPVAECDLALNETNPSNIVKVEVIQYDGEILYILYDGVSVIRKCVDNAIQNNQRIEDIEFDCNTNIFALIFTNGQRLEADLSCIAGGGGGSQTLQQTTEFGNTSDNEIIVTTEDGFRVNPSFNGETSLIGALRAETIDFAIDGNTYLLLSRLFGDGEGYNLSTAKIIPNRTLNGFPGKNLEFELPNESGRLVTEDEVTLQFAVDRGNIIQQTTVDDGLQTLGLSAAGIFSSKEQTPFYKQTNLNDEYLIFIRHVITDANYVTSRLRQAESATPNQNKSLVFNLPDKPSGEYTIAIVEDIPSNYIVVTKAQLDVLISGNTLVKGATYKVTGVHPTLYNDGNNLGTSIYVKAVEINKISQDGIGEFYNPKYNLAVNDFGIWNNISHMTATVPVTGVLKPGELITANNGATATLISGFSFNRIFFIVISGDWTTATSASNAGGVITNLSVPIIRSYAIGAKVFYGGYTWINATGLVGSATNAFTLDANWTKVSYNLTDYNLAYDAILYDYANNVITKRTDQYNNIVEHEFADIAYFNSYGGTPISGFQWGNRLCHRNIVHSSLLQSINLMGETESNELSGQSVMAGNVMFHNLAIVEGTNMLLIKNILKTRSEIRNNFIIEGSFLDRNILESNSTISSNYLYNSARIHESVLRLSSAINSNQIRRAVWVGNRLEQTSTISSNLSNQNTCHITANRLFRNSQINSNTLNGIYVQAVGSDRGYIHNNDLNNATISLNTFNVISNRRNIYINNNILLGDINQDIAIRTAAINGCTITGNANTYIRMCQLRAAQILNANIDNAANDFRFIDLEDYVWDFAGVLAAGGKIDGVKANSKSITASFLKTFDGSAGSGDIGNVIIPAFQAPTGYFIEEVVIDVKTALVGTGAILNLGIAVDNTQSGINDLTGDIANLNTAGITKIIQTTFTKAVATRAILLEVKTAAITGGQIGITLRISKL